MKTKHPGGRPPKFNEARQRITVTLPDRTLKGMLCIDSDRAQAIAKAVDALVGVNSVRKPVEIVEVLPGKAIVLVGPNQCLKKIQFLDQIEVAPARYLLIISSNATIESLELALGDMRQSLMTENDYERTILEQLLQYITHHRRRKAMTKSELLLFDIPSK